MPAVGHAGRELSERRHSVPEVMATRSERNNELAESVGYVNVD